MVYQEVTAVIAVGGFAMASYATFVSFQRTKLKAKIWAIFGFSYVLLLMASIVYGFGLINNQYSYLNPFADELTLTALALVFGGVIYYSDWHHFLK